MLSIGDAWTIAKQLPEWFDKLQKLLQSGKHYEELRLDVQEIWRNIADLQHRFDTAIQQQGVMWNNQQAQIDALKQTIEQMRLAQQHMQAMNYIPTRETDAEMMQLIRNLTDQVQLLQPPPPPSGVTPEAPRTTAPLPSTPQQVAPAAPINHIVSDPQRALAIMVRQELTRAHYYQGAPTHKQIENWCIMAFWHRDYQCMHGLALQGIDPQRVKVKYYCQTYDTSAAPGREPEWEKVLDHFLQIFPTTFIDLPEDGIADLVARIECEAIAAHFR